MYHSEGDDAEAVKWYPKAAGQEGPMGQFNLGEMYYRILSSRAWEGRGIVPFPSLYLQKRRK